MKNIKKITSKKWFYLFLIPLSLFLLGVISSFYYIFTYDTHFTVMPIVHTKNAELQTPQSLLVDGTVIKGEFAAADSNLGAIALHIKNRSRESKSDNYKIFFRIKEKGSKVWHSSNSYNAGQFYELDLFPFGFNLIPDSKGKIYTFEMFSKGSNVKNALTVEENQRIVGLYQLNKSDLKKQVFAMQYVAGKIVYLFHNLESIFFLLTFFLPTYAYFYIISEMEKAVIPAFLSSVLLIDFIRQTGTTNVIKALNVLLHTLKRFGLLEEYKPVKFVSLLNILLFFTILIEIFLLEKTNNYLLFLILALWGISIKVHKIRLQSSFLLALAFLVASFLCVFLQIDIYAEKLAIWAYLFLVIGAVHAIFISVSEKRNDSRK